MSDKHTSYRAAGVDPGKAQSFLGEFAQFMKTRKRDPNIVAGIGPFASLYQLGPRLKELKDPLLVTSCDGVGTKLKLALEWNDLSGIGQDLVAMNANDLLCTGASPTLFLDYFACGHLEREAYLAILKGIAIACEAVGCSLVGGETAEMPGVYQGNDIDLAGFVVGLVDRERVLGPHGVREGDQLVAIKSQGFHSNGYSLVRKIIASEKILPEQKAPFSQKTWKEILLQPTPLYHRVVECTRARIGAAAHITGGGLYENLPRILPSTLRAHVFSDAWVWPDEVRYMQRVSKMSDEETLSTFNAGAGFILICRPEHSAEVQQKLRAISIDSWLAGVVTTRSSHDSPILWHDQK